MKAMTLFWLSVFVISLFGIYKIKYKVRDLKAEVANLQAEVEKEYETVHVLEAEWAYLTRPNRLSELSKKYLSDLKPLNGIQLLPESTIEALPQTKREVNKFSASSNNKTQKTNDILQPVSGVYHD